MVVTNTCQAFRLLDSIAEIKDGKKWWQLPLEDFEKENPWTSVPNSANVEMTGYALLTMLNREDSKFEEAIPVVNWMLEQQNSQGGEQERVFSDNYGLSAKLNELYYLVQNDRSGWSSHLTIKQV